MRVPDQIILVCKALPQLSNSSDQVIVPLCQLGRTLLERHENDVTARVRIGLAILEACCGVVAAVVCKGIMIDHN